MAERQRMAERHRMVAKYKCPDCGSKWKSTNSSGGLKKCNSCGCDFIKVYKMRPIEEKDIRKFGTYDCECGNYWASGNTWVGKWQKCKQCLAKVIPSAVYPLRGDGVSTGKKPHESALCQKCIELGSNCREYNPPPRPSASGDEDDVSIISEASSISSSSWTDEQQLSDEDCTPIASDNEEEMEPILLDKMKKLSLSKREH